MAGGVVMRLKSHWPLSIPYGICAIINLMLPLVLVRLLSVESMGHYKLYFLYFTIGQWIFLGPAIRSGISFWLRNPENGPPVIRSAWTVLVASSVVLLIFGLGLVHGLGPQMDLAPGEGSLLVLTIFVTALGSFYEETLIATGSTVQGGLYYLTFESLKTLLVIGAALYFKQLWPVITIFFTVQVIKLSVSLVRGSSLSYTQFNLDRSYLHPVLKFALPIYFSAGIGVLLNYADQLVASHALSAKDFAYYSLGCLALPPLLLFEQSVNRILIPHLASELSTEGQADRARLLWMDAVEELGLFFIPSVIGLILFAQPIVDLLFTERYARAVPYLRLYSLDYLCFIIPFDAIQRAKGDAAWILKNSMTLLLISFTLGMITVRVIGPYGPLLTLLLTHAILRASTLHYLKTQLGWDWRQAVPWRSLGRFLLNSVYCVFLVCCLRPFFLSSKLWFLSSAPIFFVLYLVRSLPERWQSRSKRSDETRVLMVSQFLRIGGLEKMILNLSSGLKNEKRKTAFIFAYEETRETATLLSRFEAQGIRVQLFKKQEGFSLRVVFELIRFIFQNDIHVIHTHDLSALIYGAFAKLLSIGKVRLIHSQHTFVHLEKFGPTTGRKYLLYEKFFSRFPDLICPVSESLQARYLELGIPRSRTQVVLNGTPFPLHSSLPEGREELIQAIQDPVTRVRLSQQINSIWILCLARVSIEKGQNIVLKIWESLSASDQNRASILFVGPTCPGFNLDPISIKHHEPNSRVFLLGPSNTPEKWVRAAHLYISGSEFEGLPLGPLEALGAGRPAFLSDIHGHRILAPWSELFPLHSHEKASEQLSALIHQFQRNQSHGNEQSYYSGLWESASSLRDQFSLSKMVQTYGEVYDRTCF